MGRDGMRGGPAAKPPPFRMMEGSTEGEAPPPRKPTTTRTVHPKFNPRKKGEGDQMVKKEVGNPVTGVMWLTMGKVIFPPLLAAGASMSAGGVTLGKFPGPPGSSSQQRAKMLHR